MGGVVDAISSAVSSVGDAVFNSPIVNTVASVASVVPGPWQPFAAGYKVMSALDSGNIAGAALSYAGMGGSDFIPFADYGGAVDPTSYGSWDVGDFSPDDLAFEQDWADVMAGRETIGDVTGTFSGLPTVSGGSLFGSVGNNLSKILGANNPTTGKTFGETLMSSGMQTAGGLLQAQAMRDAAEKQAAAQIESARIAAEAAKFKPVGVTSRFGTSQFGYDDKGNLNRAGYMLSPEMKAQQDKLMGVSENMLSQYQAAPYLTAPMGAASQRMMSLGNQYLATSPQAQAAKYLAEQQALLATGRERELASLENRLMQQGRLGLSTGGTSTGMMAANPELEAFYNAKRQQDLQLAAQATQGGMDYAKFGAGMVGSGGDMLRGMYGVQTAAYDPYKTALGGASYIEGLGQQAMDTGINIGAKGTAASAQSGLLMGQGMQNAAATQYKADATSPWAIGLFGAGNALDRMQWGT